MNDIQQTELFEVGPRVKPTAARRYPTPDLPGSGPAGETCGSCRHKVKPGGYLKCGLMRNIWTHGAATDIRARWPACAKWEPKQAKEAT